MTRTALALMAGMSILGGSAAGQKSVEGVRVWSQARSTRVVIEATGSFTYRADRAQNPDRLFFDISGAHVKLHRRGVVTLPVGDRLLKQVRVAQWQSGVIRVVFDLAGAADYSAKQLTNPDRLIVELRPAGAVQPEPPAPAPTTTTTSLPAKRPTARESAAVRTKFQPPPSAPRGPVPRPVMVSPPLLVQESLTVSAITDPTRARERASRVVAKAKPADILRNTGEPPSLTRVLGLKVGRIVLDAGHGGHDTGTTGPNGYLEKDLVLDVVLRLGELIDKKMGAEVVYTRNDDTFIPLQDRTKIANEQHADLFLSVHANSSPDGVSAGVETYYLNFTTNQYALEVAARENAASDRTVNDLPNLVQQIAKNDKVEESRQFAAKVQTSMYSFSARGNSKSRDRGVKKAPFVVLVGAQMPSILCEIGFLSNAKDEAMMKKPEYRQKIAEALYKGLAQYAGTLSHFQIATRK
jgi:N-acetylmuramoyl-L-alanine amidase